MNKNSNKYTIIYATVMVVIVATVLAFAALSLKDKQAENVRIEKMGDILRSIGAGGDAAKAPDKAKYITEEYDRFITDTYAVNIAGDKVDGADAFQILINLKAEYDKPAEERELPVFESKNDAGEVSYIIPVWGAGLWGPVWGYIALADDWNTVNGVVFDHKGETPGLGAEIAGSAFQVQFKGKQILKDGKVESIILKKGGQTEGNPYAVDAISGGTLTSTGVEKMLRNCLGGYQAYIDKQLAGKNIPQPVQDTVTININSEIDE